MFAKLALRNVRRQIRNYLIYFITVALSVALLFAINNLIYSAQIRRLAEVSNDMDFLFNMVTILSCLVTALVLSYAAAFMLRLRKKEFGMYLTLGMTRRNIQTLFVCETGLLFAFATLAGMAAGLVFYQLLSALFASIMEFPFAVSAYSARGVLLTVAISAGMFLLSALASLRYLKRVTVSELLKAEAAERSERHPAVWAALSALSVSGLVACSAAAYRSLMAAFNNADASKLLAWLALALAMVFLSHVALSRSVTGMLLRSARLKNRSTNAVVLRALSGKMTMNSLLIGALAALLVFATAMANVSLGDKLYSDRTIRAEYPYDVMALFDLSENQAVSMEEGRRIIERYSPIAAQVDYQLYSNGETTLSRTFLEYEQMRLVDKYLPLSQFNALLTGCGEAPVALEGGYLLVTSVQGICDVDFSGKSILLNGETYVWAGSSASHPKFTREEFYFVVPDEALDGMPVSDRCAAYTLENHRPDALALMEELTYERETEYGVEEACDYYIQEDYRIYSSATSGTLIIGALYVATVFVCLALAVLSLKTLSTLEEERRRFAVLFRLGAGVKAQKRALFQQIGAFFLAPFVLPLFATVPFGLTFGEIYKMWGFADLGTQKAMETAVLISLVVALVCALYFAITYRIACNHVICYGRED